jgi:dipeptidyl aminopeptidase/acylaminoacyl peptidase
MRPVLVFPVVRLVVCLVVCLAGFWPSRATAQPAAGRPIELADYYRLESAGGPALSPDGSKVAFERTYILENDNRRHSEVWLAPTDGGAPYRLTTPAFSASNPRFSPDGALLAFSSRRRLPGSSAASEDDSSVWFLRLDRPGGEAYQIPGVEGTPLWSPDGRLIAFTKATPPGPKPKPPALSEFERKIAERFKGRVFDWMQYRVDGRGYQPDPRDPLATPPDELYVVGREGGSPRRLTSLGFDVREPEWSPDGKSLVIVANAHQRDEYTYDRSDLWVVSLENGATRRLTNDGQDHGAPTWSPDGRSIAFTRQQGLTTVIARKQTHGGPVDLYVMPAQGGPPRNLTATWDLRPGPPRFSPDGRFVYFTAGAGGSTHLFRVPAAGGNVEPVTQGERRLGGLTFSRAFDRVAYLAADANHPPEVMTAPLADGRPGTERRLSHLNDGLLGQLALARTERISYPSRDGTRIEGWVVVPSGYDARRRYPLILAIHGGPHGAYGCDFSFPFQLLAAQGYLVVFTNPRGSTNYGEKFLWATWGGWGNLDSEDVLAGVDHAASRWSVDRKRLGVTGYSYGGFLTNWLVATTNRFAAAVAGAGPASWISDFATSDIPRTKESEFFGGPWEPRGRETLLRQSPVAVSRLAKASTPTMFIHGESDFRVPIEQAEQMYLALKKLRVPAKFVRYPDTSHGGWTPWNTVHRYQQELKWWDQHLKSGAAGSTVAGRETPRPAAP